MNFSFFDKRSSFSRKVAKFPFSTKNETWKNRSVEGAKGGEISSKKSKKLSEILQRRKKAKKLASLSYRKVNCGKAGSKKLDYQKMIKRLKSK